MTQWNIKYPLLSLFSFKHRKIYIKRSKTSRPRQSICEDGHNREKERLDDTRNEKKCFNGHKRVTNAMIKCELYFNLQIKMECKQSK